MIKNRFSCFPHKFGKDKSSTNFSDSLTSFGKKKKVFEVIE